METAQSSICLRKSKQKVFFPEFILKTRLFVGIPSYEMLFLYVT